MHLLAYKLGSTVMGCAGSFDCNGTGSHILKFKLNLFVSKYVIEFFLQQF